MKSLVGLHLILALVFSFFYDTFFISFIGGVAAALAFYIPVFFLPGRFITQVMAGVSLQLFVILHIYQLHGLAEMHFFFFTSTTAMIIYQSGRAVYPGVFMIILQHISFAVLQNFGVNIYFWENDYVNIAKLVFHFGIALGNAALASYFANMLLSNTIKDALLQWKLIEKGKKLTEAKAAIEEENVQKTEELNQARELQQSILPSNRLRTKSWEVMVDMETCLEVGGDFYDYIVHGEDHMTIAIGDATGHGMKAAIVVAASKSLFQTFGNSLGPIETMRLISRGLENLKTKGTYMGLTLISIHKNKVSVASSGMPPVWLLRSAESHIETLTVPGPFLGFALGEAHYSFKEIMMQPGDRILAISDGLMERFNSKRQILGWTVIQSFFRSRANVPLEMMVKELKDFAMKWLEGAKIPDDTTILAIDYQPIEKENNLILIGAPGNRLVELEGVAEGIKEK